MPPKPDKSKDDKSKDKKKEKNEGPLPNVLVTRLMRTYKANCEVTESSMSPRLIEMMEKCIIENTLIVKFIMESPTEEHPGRWPLKLEPLIKALRSERYVHVKDLYIWSYTMCYETMATLSTFMAMAIYPIRILELRESLVTPKHVKRMAECLKSLKNLTTLNLDYNEFGDEGCFYLCDGLTGNKVLTSLSLNYCDLGPGSGSHLNDMINFSAVRDLYLDGNNLTCVGANLLISYATDMAISEEQQRSEIRRNKAELEAERLKNQKRSRPGTAEPTKDDKKPEKKKKKGKKGPKVIDEIRIGPYIRTLSLADNTLDNMTFDTERDVVVCMKNFSVFIATSSYLTEIDLGGNLIGNLAALELVEGLKQRATHELAPIKMRTTHRLDETVYTDIRSLAGGASKGKKKGKRKKK